MATITKPASPGYKSVNAIRRTTTKMAISPYNFTQQVASLGGKLKAVEFELPPMKEADAINWCGFLDDLNGFENTWNEDLTDIYPDESGLSSVAMRLAEPDIDYSISTAMHYGISFKGLEAL